MCVASHSNAFTVTHYGTVIECMCGCMRACADLSVLVSLSFDGSGTLMKILIFPQINISRVLSASD